MSTSALSDVRPTSGVPAGQRIRQWRVARRRSQMDLAQEAGISPRHLSFVETGRSNASRTTLSSLAVALDLSLRDHNTLMLAAGYAPPHPSNPWTAPGWESVHRSLAEMVQAHAPFPAMVVDFKGDILLANSVLLALLGDVADDQKPLNSYRLVLEPDGIGDRIVNRDVWQSLLAGRILDRAAETGDPTLSALAEAVTVPPRTAVNDERSASAPVVPLLLRYGEDVLTLAGIRAYLTEPRDVTAAELCLESFIPLDAGTRTILAQLADMGAQDSAGVRDQRPHPTGQAAEAL